MKAHIPYFSFYPSDFMNGVRGLSAQEVGVYTMLLCRIYEENGPVEYHPLRLATYCGMRVATFEAVVAKLVDLGKLSRGENMLSNPRAEAEISKRANDLKNSSKAGKASAEKRQQKQQNNSTDVQQAFNHTNTDTDTERSSSSSAREPIAETAVGGSEADRLWHDLIAAVGLQNGRLPTHWMPPAATMHVQRWMSDLGLTHQQIIEIAQKNRAQYSDPPNGPKALDAAMRRMAGQLAAPKLQPIQQNEGQNGQYRNTQSGQSANGRGNGVDPAIAQIARLAGIGRA